MKEAGEKRMHHISEYYPSQVVAGPKRAGIEGRGRRLHPFLYIVVMHMLEGQSKTRHGGIMRRRGRGNKTYSRNLFFRR